MTRAIDDAPLIPDADTMERLPEDPQTLSQMLQWSLEHTDLDALHQKAQAIRAASSEASLSADGNQNDLLNRPAALPQPKYKSVDEDPVMRERLRTLSEVTAALMPDQVKLMREALELAANETVTDEEREHGLHNLQELVSDIDNARDLKAINEYPTVLAHLISERPAMQTAAAWVIGSAVQNHRELQLHLLSLGALTSLLRLISSHASVELRAKALYAASGMLRNCPEAQEEFMRRDGIAALVSALKEMHTPKLVRKALVLLTDLLDEQFFGDLPADLEATPTAIKVDADASVSGSNKVHKGLLESGWTNGSHLCEAISECLAMADTDTQEKAVLALQKLSSAGVVTHVGQDCAKEPIMSALEVLMKRCRGDEGGSGMTEEGCTVTEALWQTWSN